MEKEILKRLNQFIEKFFSFEIRLSEVELFQNQLLQLNQNMESISQNYSQNAFEKQNNTIIQQLEQNINKLIKESLQKKEEQEKPWKDRTEKDIQNLQKLIEEIQNQRYLLNKNEEQRNLQNLTQTLPSWNEQDQQLVKNTIEDIYSKTIKSRCVSVEFQYFIHEIQDQSELGKYYNLKLDQKQKINQQVSGFRQVRGDGNCFYTSFGFQYLQLLIDQYDQNQYDSFINTVIKKTRFKIEYHNIKLEEEKIENQFREEFISRLNIIRKKENKKKRLSELVKQFRAYEQDEEDKLVDGCFYALSTIFFRNLCFFLIEQSEFKDNFKEKSTLLQWEVECNNNEIVISLLAQYLKIHVCVFFFNNDQYQFLEYNQEANNKIILLLKPGHYNIGIRKIEE